MASLNNHELIGNLGQDAEVKYLNDGKLIVSFSIATKEWVPNAQPETEWWNISVYGRQAETLADLIQNNGALSKGDLVRVSGSTRLKKYTKQDGTMDARTQTNARDVTLLSSRNESQPQQQQQQQNQPPYAQQYAAPPPPPAPQYAQQPQQGYAQMPPVPGQGQGYN